jgi:hypothetical protein
MRLFSDREDDEHLKGPSDMCLRPGGVTVDHLTPLLSSDVEWPRAGGWAQLGNLGDTSCRQVGRRRNSPAGHAAGGLGGTERQPVSL